MLAPLLWSDSAPREAGDPAPRGTWPEPSLLKPSVTPAKRWTPTRQGAPAKQGFHPA